MHIVLLALFFILSFFSPAIANDLPSGCSYSFSNCQFNDYEDDMWATLQKEPCLSGLIRNKKETTRAELIYLLHKIHIYQYSLSLFCDEHGAVIPMSQIEKMFDDFTHRIYPVTEDAEPNGEGRIGVMWGYDRKNDKPTIFSAPTDGPAHHAGLRRYDVIEAIDGKSVRVLPPNLTQFLAGDPNTKLHIKVRRDDSVSREFSVLRSGEYAMSPADWDICNDIGVISLYDFSFGKIDEYLLPAFSRFAYENVKGVIIDLRGNPGGFALQASKFASMFLDRKHPLIYNTKEPYLGNELKPQDGSLVGHDWMTHIPLIILVDHFTASAAEMFAGALSVYKRAFIVGEPTFGKGTGQIPILMHNDTTIYLTSFYWYLPNGETVEQKGILPDVYREDAEARTTMPPQFVCSLHDADDRVFYFAHNRITHLYTQ